MYSRYYIANNHNFHKSTIDLAHIIRDADDLGNIGNRDMKNGQRADDRKKRFECRHEKIGEPLRWYNIAHIDLFYDNQHSRNPQRNDGHQV